MRGRRVGDVLRAGLSGVEFRVAEGCGVRGAAGWVSWSDRVGGEGC